MSFSIVATGHPEAVDRHLEQSKGYGDTSHHDAVRDAARSVIATIPAEKRDESLVTVEASGHHDFSGRPYGSATLTVKVSPYLKK